MLKIILAFCLALSLFAENVSVSSGWNMLGATKELSSSTLVSQSGERVWKFDGTSWEYYQLGKVGSIKAGEAFWLYATTSKTYAVEGVEGNSVYWNTNWSLVAPTLMSWNSLSTLFPTANYIWKFNNSSKAWELYTPSNNVSGFTSLETVALGEGVWINSTLHNGMIGESGIQTANGSFGTLSKPTKAISTEEELLAMVKNQFNVALEFNKTTSNTSQFQLAMRLTKGSSTYDFILKVYGNTYTLEKPEVKLQNSSGSMAQAFNTQPQNGYTYKYLELLNSNSVLKINFDEIIKYLIYPANGWYSASEMIDRFNTKTSYKYQIYASGLDLVNSHKITESILINNTTNFAAGSSKIEGIILVQ